MLHLDLVLSHMTYNITMLSLMLKVEISHHSSFLNTTSPYCVEQGENTFYDLKIALLIVAHGVMCP